MWQRLSNFWKRQAPQVLTEEGFLRNLAATKALRSRALKIDGAALVSALREGKCVCEFVVEVRLPGGRARFLGDFETGERKGKLWLYLQNVSDVPLCLTAPRFILTSGLALPWSCGMQIMHNLYRGEAGEVMSWILPLQGGEDLEQIAADVACISDRCQTLMKATSSISSGKTLEPQ